MNDDRVGSTCRGKQGTYQVTKHLSTGGMGIVYEGFSSNGGNVVIKFPATHMPSGELMIPSYQEKIIVKLKDEATILRELSKFNKKTIVKYIDESSNEKDFFLVIEKIEGETVSNLVKGNSGLDQTKLVKLSMDVLHGMEFLHGKNTIYRDLKPENIMADKNGGYVIIDFGTAKQGLTNTTIESSSHTKIGTPDWTCPEQDSGRASPECDLYALGRIMFHLATGIQPRQLDTGKGRMKKKISEIKTGFNQQLSDLVHELIDPEHNQIHTATDLITKLGSLSKSGYSPPRPVTLQKNQPRIVLNGTVHVISDKPHGTIIGRRHDDVTCVNTNDALRCNRPDEGTNIPLGWNCPKGCTCDINPRHKFTKHHMRIWSMNGQVYAINQDPDRRSAINRRGKWIPMQHLKKESLQNHDQVALLYNETKGAYMSFTFYTR